MPATKASVQPYCWDRAHQQKASVELLCEEIKKNDRNSMNRMNESISFLHVIHIQFLILCTFLLLVWVGEWKLTLTGFSFIGRGQRQNESRKRSKCDKTICEARRFFLGSWHEKEKNKKNQALLAIPISVAFGLLITFYSENLRALGNMVGNFVWTLLEGMQSNIHSIS
jgi:hypothetical protein